MKVLILGSQGMLGSAVLNYLTDKGVDLVAPIDTYDEQKILTGTLQMIKFSEFDYIINCIGIIGHKLKTTREAVMVNCILPYSLAEQAPKAKIIQIATDCVFSGREGHYMEDNEHDASDVYGKTKSLGEVQAKNFYNIRTSIVGRDRHSKVSLLEWFLSQPKNAKINGYKNHMWNGITTLHFAKLCYAIMNWKGKIPNNFHFTPVDVMNKYKLLKIFAE